MNTKTDMTRGELQKFAYQSAIAAHGSHNLQKTRYNLSPKNRPIALLVNNAQLTENIADAIDNNSDIFLSPGPIDKATRCLNFRDIHSIFLSPKDVHELIGIVDQDVAIAFFLSRFPRVSIFVIYGIESVKLINSQESSIVYNSTRSVLPEGITLENCHDIMSGYISGLRQIGFDIEKAIEYAFDAINRVLKSSHHTAKDPTDSPPNILRFLQDL